MFHSGRSCPFGIPDMVSRISHNSGIPVGLRRTEFEVSSVTRKPNLYITESYIYMERAPSVFQYAGSSIHPYLDLPSATQVASCAWFSTIYHFAWVASQSSSSLQFQPGLTKNQHRSWPGSGLDVAVAVSLASSVSCCAYLSAY